MGLSTTYTKAETDFLIQQLEKKTASGYKGDLIKTDVAPTQMGFYGLLETGIYTNLGGIDAQSGKLNFASFDGTIWSLIAVEIPINYNTGELSPTSTDKAETGKSVSDFLNATSTTVLNLTATQLVGKFPYKVNLVTNLRTEWVGYSDSASLVTLRYPYIYNEKDKVEIAFMDIYSDRILFVNSDRMVLRMHTLTAKEKTLKKAYLSVPKGTQEILFAVATGNVVRSFVNLYKNSEIIDRANYSYIAFDNLLNVANIEASKKLDLSGNIIAGGVGNNFIKDLPVKAGKLFMYGVNLPQSSVIVCKNARKEVIALIAKASLIFNTRSDDPTKWDFKTTVTLPDSTAFISLSTDLNTYSGLNVTDVYNAPFDKAVIWQEVNVLKDSILPTKVFKNDLKGEKNNIYPLIDQTSAFSTRTKKLVIENKSEKKFGRIAFRFRINEDLNTGAVSEKKFFEIQNLAGTTFFNFVANLGATSQLSGRDSTAHPAAEISYYPIPKFNSGFGVRTNIANVAEGRKNLNYDFRTLTMLTTTNKHLKPIVGKDLFYIRFKSNDQTILAQWSDLRLTTNDLTITLSSVNNSLNVQSTFANFGDMIDLYNDFKSKVFASTVGALVEFHQYNLGSYKPSDATLVMRTQNSDLWIEPNDICKIDVPLVSKYYNIAAGTNLYDGFPAYVPRKIDRSWHTFEFVASQNIDNAFFTVDGQWFADSGNFDFPGIRSAFEKGGKIIIGGELAIDIKDLEVEFDSYSNVELMDSGYITHVFASKMHPSVLHLFGHDLYYLEDPNIDISEFDKFQKYVSKGGFIPDNLKPENPNYKGDDGTMPVYRHHLAHPSFKLEQLFTWLQNAGYVNITHKTMSDWHREGKPLPHYKCYLIDFDDTPTYIYDDLKLRSIFKRYNCRPAFALELGYYVDETTPASYGAAAFISQCQDTNEHRLALQKRVHNMQLENWDVVIHGGKDGYYHNGRSYNEYVENIEEAIKIANYMGFDSQYWCLSSSGSTPNSVKLHEHYGILASTSTVGAWKGQCYLPNYSPRIAWETLFGRQPQVQLGRIIGDNVK